MRRWRLILPALLVPMAILMVAWDTQVIEGDIWRSTYFREGSASIPEHSTLADLALGELGVVDLFGVQGSGEGTIVDLNATFFREDELGATDREGDDRRTRVSMTLEIPYISEVMPEKGPKESEDKAEDVLDQLLAEATKENTSKENESDENDED